MGYIKEPEGVDFLVGPSVQTADDIRAIKAAIKKYKKTAQTNTVKEVAPPAILSKSDPDNYRDEIPKSKIQ